MTVSGNFNFFFQFEGIYTTNWGFFGKKNRDIKRSCDVFFFKLIGEGESLQSTFLSNLHSGTCRFIFREKEFDCNSHYPNIPTAVTGLSNSSFKPRLWIYESSVVEVDQK